MSGGYDELRMRRFERIAASTGQTVEQVALEWRAEESRINEQLAKHDQTMSMSGYQFCIKVAQKDIAIARRNLGDIDYALKEVCDELKRESRFYLEHIKYEILDHEGTIQWILRGEVPHRVVEQEPDFHNRTMHRFESAIYRVCNAGRPRNMISSGDVEDMMKASEPKEDAVDTLMHGMREIAKAPPFGTPQRDYHGLHRYQAASVAATAAMGDGHLIPEPKYVSDLIPVTAVAKSMESVRAADRMLSLGTSMEMTGEKLQRFRDEWMKLQKDMNQHTHAMPVGPAGPPVMHRGDLYAKPDGYVVVPPIEPNEVWNPGKFDHIEEACGEDLDRIAAQFGIVRHPGRGDERIPTYGGVEWVPGVRPETDADLTHRVMKHVSTYGLDRTPGEERREYPAHDSRSGNDVHKDMADALSGMNRRIERAMFYPHLEPVSVEEVKAAPKGARLPKLTDPSYHVMRFMHELSPHIAKDDRHPEYADLRHEAIKLNVIRIETLRQENILARREEKCMCSRRGKVGKQMGWDHDVWCPGRPS